MRWRCLIYGANGYTGTLIARRAAARGVPAILGGRQADAVNALAAELGRTARVFAVDDPAAVATALAGIAVVLNCAGPFSRTAAPLVDACLRARAHYLDITGELAVLESLAARDAEARAAGVTLLPGRGSTCPHRLPGGGREAAPAAGDPPGAGVPRPDAHVARHRPHEDREPPRRGWYAATARSCACRRLAHTAIDFGDRPEKAITIPWGNVATAYHTTGIGNVEVYVAVPMARRSACGSARRRPLVGSAAVKRLLKAGVQRGPAGPSAEERATRPTRMWAEARDDGGNVVTARLHTPEAYELTSWTALALAERASRGSYQSGIQTPARACGARLHAGISGRRARRRLENHRNLNRFRRASVALTVALMSDMPALESEHIRGVYVVSLRAFADSRGYFFESLPPVLQLLRACLRWFRVTSRSRRRASCGGMHYHLRQADFWLLPPSGHVRAALYDLRGIHPHARRLAAADWGARRIRSVSTSRPAWRTVSTRFSTINHDLPGQSDILRQRATEGGPLGQCRRSALDWVARNPDRLRSASPGEPAARRHPCRFGAGPNGGSLPAVGRPRTSSLARASDSNVPASVHQPASTSYVRSPRAR